MSWPEVPLEELALDDAPIVYGILKPGPNIPNGVPYVRPTEMGNRDIRLGSILRTTPKIASEFRRSTLRVGDLILSIVGTIGKIAFVPPELDGGNITQCSVRIRANQKRVDARYLSWALESPRVRRQYDEYRFGSGVPRLNVGHVRALLIPLPPLPEQCRIADILNKANAIRRKRKEAIALTEELLRSAFLDMFGDPVTNPKGWPTVAIEDLASSERNALAIGPFGSNLLASDYTESGHPVVFVRDLVTERFVWKSDVFVSTQKFEELAAHHAEPGDVLATKMGTPPGIACVVPQGFPRAVVTADVVKVSVNRAKVFPAYLAAAINSSWGRHQIAGITAGVTRAKITLRDFRNVQVRLPDMEQQRRYVDYVAKVMGAAEGQKSAMMEADALFNSLVARAFSGGLSS